MSSPLDVIGAVLTDPTFGIPILLLVATLIFWAWWSRPAPPPPLLPYRYRRAWMDTAESGIVVALRVGLFRPAVAFLYARFLSILSAQYQFPVERFDALLGPRSLRKVPAPNQVRELMSRFRGVYRRLFAAEGVSSTGFWAALVRERRKRNLRVAIADFLPTYEEVLATLQPGPTGP